MFNNCKIHGVYENDYNAFGQELENQVQSLSKKAEIVDVQLQFVPVNSGTEFHAFIFYKEK